MRVGASLLLATLLVIVVGLLYWSGGSGGHDAQAGATSRYVLLQMNLCLSGQAGCFEEAQYPLGVSEAQTRIVDTDADAVTLNEVCRDDVEELARGTGYEMRFESVTSFGEPLPCSDPGDRGLFGIAVLTKTGVKGSIGEAFRVQDEVEQRHWLCATTDDAVTVCATHLERASSETESVNDAQCEEFADVLAGLEAKGPLIAAGDMNRWESCAPAGMWTRGDDDTTQAAGVQHMYGDPQFRRPAASVIPMEYSDHDALVVTSRLIR